MIVLRIKTRKKHLRALHSAYHKYSIKVTILVNGELKQTIKLYNKQFTSYT